MRSGIFFGVLLLCATRAAFALTCGGFSVVPADHVVVKYSVPIATGAARSAPIVSVSGNDISVTRTVSGGSATEVSCSDDMLDLGSLGGGRFNLTWNDNVNFASQRSTFTFFVGSSVPAPSTGTLDYNVEVLPPAVPDQPVRLIMYTSSPAPDVAYVSGNDIHISQYGPGAGYKYSLIDLGPLPPGLYNVTRVHPGASTVSFPFIVQQPAPASPCNGSVSVTRTAGGSSRLRYEDVYYGYTPVFGPPTATTLGDVSIPQLGGPVIEIKQPIADSVDGNLSGAPRASSICHAEELDLGPLADGYHKLWWIELLSVNGADYKSRGFQQLEFWTRNGTSQCTTVPELITPSLAPENAPFDLSMNLAMLDYQPGTVGTPKVTINGQNITLDLSWYFEGSPDTLPTCKTYKATIKPLPAGEYTIAWRWLGASQPFATSHVTVGKLSRQRAARH